MTSQNKEILTAGWVKLFFDIPKSYQYNSSRQDLVRAIDDIPGDEFKETTEKLKLYL